MKQVTTGRLGDLAEILEQLTPEQRELFLLRLDRASRSGGETASIPRRGDLGPAPLSFAQERLWFLEQLQPGTPAYHMSVALRLKGPLNLAALEQSLQRIVARHEALRTAFSVRDGEPFQVVVPELDIELPTVDLRAYPADDRWRRVRQLASEEARRPFVLGRAPLMRLLLLVVGDRSHVLTLTLHHLIADGWSRSVLFGELTSGYRQLTGEESEPLPVLPVQYADYAVWQRERLRDGALARQLEYWSRRLAGAPPFLALPTDRPRPAVQTYRGRRYTASLPRALVERLKALGKSHDATLFMVLLASYQVLLARLSGSRDVVVGTPIAGRRLPEVRGLVGMFVNTLVLRGDLGGDPTFEQLLVRVRRVTLEAFEHQDVPFEKLVEELRPEREMSYSPLFQVMFALQSPMPELSLPNLDLTLLDFERSTAQFDMVLSGIETGEGLSLAVDYNTDLFDDATAERWTEYFTKLLEHVVREPARRISELRVMPETERRERLVDWNDRRARYPREATLHALFERQAEARPDAVAVCYDGTYWSYSEVARRADRVARALRRRGVGPEAPVGLAVERSPALLWGLLGILRSGGAYVPLDPDYPTSRLLFMIEDAGCQVLLTRGEVASRLAAASAHRIDLDAATREAGDVPPEPRHPATASNLAYVIYTSGSTGRPKGVQISHRSLVNFLSSMARAPGLGPSSHLLAVTTLSFDIAALELFLPLVFGARLTLASDEARRDAFALRRLWAEVEADVMQATPATWRMLLDSKWTGDGRLRLLCGGEALPRALASRLAECGRELWNLYGPTETTVWSAVRRVTGPQDREVAGLGEPIANTRIYVVEPGLRLAPLAVPGELVIGGDGLSRGYRGRPGLTAERFVPDPYATHPGERLYRTGDLVRHLRDATGFDLEYLGRIDHQVKVRGFRIELGEIEAALERHPSVSQAVAAAWGAPGASDRRLVAYLVAANAEPPENADLQAWLRDVLPEYMVPDLFTVLDRMPLTPNGKVDRRALPTPAARQAAAAYVAPRDPVEEVVAAIWSEVLGEARIGVHDNFFDLGGHSLLATQVFSRVRGAFAVELPLRALFEAPTVAGLARHVEAARLEKRGLAIPAIHPMERGEEIALSFAQQRLWFFDQLLPGNPLYNVPGAFRLTGALDIAALRATLDEIVGRHEALRTTFSSTDGRPRQVIAPGRGHEVPVIDLGALAPALRMATLERLAEWHARRPFDLIRGPLLRTTLLLLAPEEHVLLVNMHHIISDGWSIGVLTREVSAVYGALVGGRPSPLPPLSIQYPDFALWQRQWLRGEALERQLEFWRRQLTDIEPLELPADRPRPPVSTYRGRARGFDLGEDLTGALRILGRRQGATLFMVVLAALKTLFHRYTGQIDIAVGTAIANRNRAEIEPLIGFFVNTLVMRSSLAGKPTFREFLTREREVALEAYAHQDLPFEHLVDVMRPERDMNRMPFFQVMFTLQNAPRSELEMAGVHLERLEVETGTAKFDLFFAISERDEALVGALEYNSDIFDDDRIVRLLGHLEEVLQGIAEDSDRTLAELPLLSESERCQLAAWNRTGAPYPRGASIAELFEGQAEATPARTALVMGSAALTYGELNCRANRVAHYLRSLGVGRGALVGLCVERSLELVVGILGILKAGAAFAPLDATYPKARLAFMLSDTRTPVLLIQEQLLRKLPVPDARVVKIDVDWPEIARSPATNPPAAATAEDLAYVMYTSGSTGRPKGIEVPHRAVVRLVRSTNYADLVGEVFLQHSPVSFDASTLELWGGLLNGGSLVMFPPQVPSPASLGEIVERHRVSTLWLTAGLFHLTVDTHLESLRPVWQLLAGGDVLSVPHVRRTVATLGCRVINGYGPTENTTFTCCYPMTRAEQVGESVPIGFPIAQTRVYVLDALQQPAPIGVSGELFAAGDGLARGYLNRRALTAERFVPDPWSERPGGRMYRTGDRASFRGDGALMFFGRIDQQVKLRGFRIEPGEIETALLEDPAMTEAVVALREDVPGDQRLVAYLVSGDFDPSVAVEERDQEDYVSQWQSLFDSTYVVPETTAATTAAEGEEFNIRGWNSSYTDEPIPAEEMREWVDDTVRRILERPVDRVFEIGCGTGLLLFRIAPSCRRYRASDFSQAALDYLQPLVAARDLDQVELVQAMADDFTGVEVGGFDAVVLNSIVQYFPDVGYLTRVLEQAVEAVAPGGVVFVGDVRSLPLLETLHTSVEAFQAPPSLTAGELRERVRRRAEQEEEMIVDPAYFLDLAARSRRIRHVEIVPKRGRQANELTRFRYQVILHVGERPTFEPESFVDWRRAGWSLDRLRTYLAAEGPEFIAFEDVPNARVASEYEIVERLARAEPDTTLEELRREAVATAAIDPQALWALGAELAYRVDLGWARHGAAGAFDMVLRRADTIDVDAPAVVRFPRAGRRQGPVAATNQPLQGKLNRRLVPRLRERLRRELPEYMIPAAFVFLDQLPLNPNGKVDRRALPAPERLRPMLEVDYIAPEQGLERAVAEIWQEVLQVENVGRDDNFFELGGNSLLLVQIHRKLEKAMARPIELIELFNHSTVASIAEFLSRESEDRGLSTEKIDERATTRRSLMQRQRQARLTRRSRK